MDGLSWLIIVACAAMSLLLTACNNALRTFNRIRLAEELSRRGRGDQLEPMLRRLGQLVLATAALRILLNITLILALAYVLRHLAERHWGLHLLSVGAVAFVVIMVFSVAIPNAWARYAGEPLLARTLGLVLLVGRLLVPVTRGLHWLDEVVRRLTGAPRVRDDVEHLEREILSAVTEGEREGVVDPQEKEMIQSVLEFQDTQADQIMTPRTDIVALEAGSELPVVLETIRRAGHSRIPVFEGNLDNIVGVLYAKDLLWRIGNGGEGAEGTRGADGPIRIRDVMRTPLFVPESRPINGLLNDLRRSKVHLAVVLDEFGGTAGLVTVEDILEEIVGEIADEHDRPAPSLIRRIDERTFEVDGRLHVDDLNDQLNLHLPEEEDYDTISGLVISELGHIPTPGEKVRRDNLTLTVTQSEPRKINLLRLEVASPLGSDGES